ncbi:helix-turn-helix domain-containing protein [Chloroflexota bacterium]
MLLMLAIADFADDAGFAYPGVPRLAQKCRLVERSIQKIIHKCEESSELTVSRNKGIKTPSGWTNLYRINVKALKERAARGENFAPLKDEKPLETRGENFSPVNPSSPHEVNPSSPKPSVEPLGNLPTNQPGNNGPQYTDIDADGNEAPVVYNKNNPEFRAVMTAIYGRIFNLEGQERTNWVKALKRMKDDPQFREWCFYVAENDAKGQHINYWFKIIFNEHSFARYCNGSYVSEDEYEKLKKQSKRNTPQKEPTEYQEGTSLFEESQVVEV